MIVLKRDTEFHRLAERGIVRRSLGLRTTEEERGALHRARLGHALDEAPGRFDLELDGTHAVRERHAARRERRALSAAQGSTGGFMVPHGALLGGIEHALDVFNPLRDAGATVHRTVLGDDHKLAFVDDQLAEGTVSGENQSPGDIEDMSFGAAKFVAKNFKTGTLAVPMELVEDAGDPFVQAMGTALGRRIARAQARRWTQELIASVPSTAAASATSIGIDDIATLINAVGSGYLEQPGSVFLMAHPTVITAMWKLKDGAGSLMMFPPGKPFGYRIIRNKYMPSAIAAGAVSLLCGWWPAVHVADHRSLRIDISTEARIEYGQVTFRGQLRSAMSVVQSADEPAIVRLVHPE